MYRLADGTIVNLEWIAYITPADKSGKCRIWLIDEDTGIECTPWDAEGILQLCGMDGEEVSV